MATRITTKRNPWHYTECGLGNVYLVGIVVQKHPDFGVDEPIIPRIEELHNRIFFGLLRKPGPLTGKEVRFLRGHLLWTQAQANDKLGQSSAQYFSALERKGDRPAFDLHTDLVWRLLCAKAFHDQSKGRRRAEATATMRMLEQVETVLAMIKTKPAQRPIEFKQKDDKWQAATESLAA